MIIEGLKLTVLGMTVVYLFLALLIAVIQGSARLLRPWTEREALAAASQGTRRARGASAAEQQRKVMAVIGAAVAAHRGQGRRG